MRRSAYRRAAAAPTGRNRRLFAVGAVITALGAAVAFTTISSAATNDAPAGSGAGKVVNGQVILTDTCVDSNLEPHDGFQKGDRCVSTEFGELGVAVNNPSLLITSAPRSIAVNTPFTLKVSTRNLIRDRFLAAGKGGYYVESSVLQNGIVRGHFHTACRMLTSTNEAPAPDPVPAFFVATEDQKGSATPDEVTIAVPGLPQIGTAQCASWAGDGSHRIPMMERANQTPALDAVRIAVRGQQGGGNTGGGNTGGGNTGGGNGNTGGNNGGGNNGGGNNGATTAPTTAPATTAPATTAPATPTQGATTAPTTKDDFTPDPTKPAATTKPATGSGQQKPTQTKTAKPAATRTTEPATGGSDNGGSDNGGSGTTTGDSDSTGSDDTTPATPTKKAAKPATSSKAAGTDFTYSNDDGQINSGNGAPVADQVAEVQSASGGEKKDGGVLALTGSNAIAAVGGAVVLLLVGLIIMAFTRRRGPGGTTWQ